MAQVEDMGSAGGATVTTATGPRAAGIILCIIRLRKPVSAQWYSHEYRRQPFGRQPSGFLKDIGKSVFVIVLSSKLHTVVSQSVAQGPSSGESDVEAE